MAVSNRERLDRGFQELAGGLAPFMQRELARKFGAGLASPGSGGI